MNGDAFWFFLILFADGAAIAMHSVWAWHTGRVAIPVQIVTGGVALVLTAWALAT